jgi:hypothetical protein
MAGIYTYRLKSGRTLIKMKIKGHGISAVPLAAAVYGASGSWSLSLCSALGAIFVDLDHIPEYVVWNRFRFNVKDFFSDSHAHATPWVVYPLHGWEALLAALVVFYTFEAAPWFWALLLGWAYHLVWDQLMNPVGLGFYFLSFRARYGFVRKKLWGYWGVRCVFNPIKRGRGWLE